MLVACYYKVTIWFVMFAAKITYFLQMAKTASSVLLLYQIVKTADQWRLIKLFVTAAMMVMI